MPEIVTICVFEIGGDRLPLELAVDDLEFGPLLVGLEEAVLVLEGRTENELVGDAVFVLEGFTDDVVVFDDVVVLEPVRVLVAVLDCNGVLD